MNFNIDSLESQATNLESSIQHDALHYGNSQLDSLEAQATDKAKAEAQLASAKLADEATKDLKQVPIPNKLLKGFLPGGNDGCLARFFCCSCCLKKLAEEEEEEAVNAATHAATDELVGEIGHAHLPVHLPE